MDYSSSIADYHKSICELGTSLNEGDFVSEPMVREALTIRVVEESFLSLFTQGRMNGTVHTCIGQEFIAVAVAGRLRDGDWVTSNHRCHGHFISKTKNWKGLVDELMGLESGVCKGIGSSQHLYEPGFLSNGPQGALLPVGTGIALCNKIPCPSAVVVSFLGEGTLGEGVVYEALNIASLYKAPQLFVCENNMYSQSTPQEDGVAGDILARAKAFNIRCFESDTWNIGDLLTVSQEAIDYVRASGKPAFMLIRTYRLNAHSKGDDDRNREEIEWFRERDVLSVLLKQPKWKAIQSTITAEVDKHVQNNAKKVLDFESYCLGQNTTKPTGTLSIVSNDHVRMVQALNSAYRSTLRRGAVHIGEDICDPYGGAFKVTKGLSTDYPNSVINAPISECGIVGVCIGYALMGVESYAEIMFGDFVTNIVDQLVNNASKMHHMYGFQVNVPLRVRTPMGGKRGYGPTHSQSLEKMLLGIDNLTVIAFSSLYDPDTVIRELCHVPHPVILLENKVDYGKYLWTDTDFLSLSRDDNPLGSLILQPKGAEPTITIVTYGECARQIADNLLDFFVETDLLPEVVCVAQIYPLNIDLIESSVKRTGKLLTIEDGSIGYGFGSEVIARLAEMNVQLDFVCRIGAEDVPIPSVSELENQVLPTMTRIIRLVQQKMGILNDC